MERNDKQQISVHGICCSFYVREQVGAWRWVGVASDWNKMSMSIIRFPYILSQFTIKRSIYRFMLSSAMSRMSRRGSGDIHRNKTANGFIRVAMMWHVNLSELSGIQYSVIKMLMCCICILKDILMRFDLNILIKRECQESWDFNWVLFNSHFNARPQPSTGQERRRAPWRKSEAL